MSKTIIIREVFEIVISDQVCNSNQQTIEIVISDQVCDCHQVGVDYYKRLRLGECVPHHLTRDEQNDRNQGGV